MSAGSLGPALEQIDSIRLGLQQRVLPSYRIPFFDALAKAFPRGLSVFAGQPRPEESIDTSLQLQLAQFAPATNHHILRGPLYLCWQSGFLEWLETWQPGALIVEANPRYLRTPAAVHWMKGHGPVLGWGLGAPEAGGLLKGWRKVNRERFLKQFDALLTYSQQGADQYHAAGFPANRIFVARNAVAPRPNQPAPQRPQGFTAGRASVLFVGRLQQRKRVDLLLRACAALPAALQPRLVIVGDGPARAELQELASQNYPETEFSGARHGADLQPFFEQADLFVLPGSGGLAIQQAMSFALPVIVGEGDGTQSDLLRPENGWSIPAGDLSALTAALANALSDPLNLRQMGLASYRIVSDEINLEAMVRAFVEAVNSVL